MQTFDVLSGFELGILETQLELAEFKDVSLGDDVVMSVAPVSDWLAERLTSLVGGNLELITMYFRYNSSEVDTSFRIHSDGSILGQYPDWACVYYLDDGDTGTALFDHPEYGAMSRGGNVFEGDDGRWEVYEYYPQVANSMAVYRAELYHSRWPHEATDDRFVIVGFFKEV